MRLREPRSLPKASPASRKRRLAALAEWLEGLFGGGSTPAPKKAPEPEPKRKLTMKEFLAEEQAQRTAKIAAIKQQIESGQSVTQEDLNSLPAEQQRTETEAEDNLFSPDDGGSTSSRAGTDRAAQDQRGEDGNRKTGLEPNLFQRPEIDDAAAYVQLCQNPAQDWTAWLAEIDQQPAPPPDSDEVSPTAGIIDAYLKLCQNPAEDWQAWHDDASFSQQGGLHDDHGDTAEFYHDPLPELQRGLDARNGREAVDRLLFRQAAGRPRLDELRPLRSATGQTELTAVPPIDAPPIDAEAMRARRFAMLQRFMRAARFTLSQFPTWRSRRRGKGKGKLKTRSTGGGQAAQLRQQQNRSARRAAWLGRLLPARFRTPAPRRPDRTPPRGTPPASPRL